MQTQEDNREQLIRVGIHSRRTDYKMFLLVWGKNALDAIDKLQAVVGPDAEYQLDSAAPCRKDGQTFWRERKGGDAACGKS